jgi:hypothetical protein
LQLHGQPGIILAVGCCVNPLVACCLVFTAAPVAPPAEKILAGAFGESAKRHTVPYSGVRRYTMRNFRFGKEATLLARVTSCPGEGKRFTVIERSGSAKLLELIEKLISQEVESSWPHNRAKHEIGPSNYQVEFRGSAMVTQRDCWVLALRPKAKSKYLVSGTVWIDKATNGLVRLDGTTAASVSMWVGNPHVVEEFVPVAGIWFPAHTASTSNSMLLGESNLEIRYWDYQVDRPR